jgi:hypothetical protein
VESTSAPAPLGEAGVALGADDDVVEDRDAAEVADLAQPLGELDVLTRGRGVSCYGDLAITGVMGRP